MPHDNVTMPHTAAATIEIIILKLKALTHPPHRLDPTLPNYHLFRTLNRI
jgi:hypothetical protein